LGERHLRVQLEELQRGRVAILGINQFVAAPVFDDLRLGLEDFAAQLLNPLAEPLGRAICGLELRLDLGHQILVAHGVGDHRCLGRILGREIERDDVGHADLQELEPAPERAHHPIEFQLAGIDSWSRRFLLHAERGEPALGHIAHGIQQLEHRRLVGIGTQRAVELGILDQIELLHHAALERGRHEELHLALYGGGIGDELVDHAGNLDDLGVAGRNLNQGLRRIQRGLLRDVAYAAPVITMIVDRSTNLRRKTARHSSRRLSSSLRCCSAPRPALLPIKRSASFAMLSYPHDQRCRRIPQTNQSRTNCITAGPTRPTLGQETPA
jgi:hypothetical protein